HPPPTTCHKGRGNVWLEGDSKFQQQISGKETMAIQAPSAEHVKEIAASFGIALSEADAASFAGLLKGVAASYDRIDAMVEPKPEVKYARTTGAQPKAADNRYNAWA